MFSQISDLFINSMMSLLDFLKSITGSYGWAIVIFGAMVKAALYLPTQSQYKSMKEMQKIQPELKKLQDKYKKDPQKLQMEQMKLFKDHNVNPLGGCLPILIQMPILIGIFATIRKMAALGKFADQTFMWIGGPLSDIYPGWIGGSLAQRDTLLVLIYAVSMFLSQKMTPSSGSDQGTQKLMGTLMPIMFTFILWNFPSSLILYWLVFNILSIVQQYFTLRETPESGAELKKKETAAEDEELEEEEEDEDEEEEEKDVSPTGKTRSRSRKKKGGK